MNNNKLDRLLPILLPMIAKLQDWFGKSLDLGNRQVDILMDIDEKIGELLETLKEEIKKNRGGAM
jgi:hypothetical protein